MTKLATLTGHTLRVLYLAVSPDGQTIVTGAGGFSHVQLCMHCDVLLTGLPTHLSYTVTRLGLLHRGTCSGLFM